MRPYTYCAFRNGQYHSGILTPEEFGFERCRKEDLKGGAPEENARITERVLKGEKGPRRNTVLMNGGAALFIAGKARDMREGVKLAGELIDSGKAFEKLEEFRAASQKMKEEE